MREYQCFETDLKISRDFEGKRIKTCDNRSILLAITTADEDELQLSAEEMLPLFLV